jgi:hypothetical protein
MGTEKYIKPGVVGTEKAVIITHPPGDGAQVFTVLPLPEAWKEMVNLDVEAFWKEEGRKHRDRRRARLEKCEFDECDPDIDHDHDNDLPMDSEWSLPGYDPDDFKEDR